MVMDWEERWIRKWLLSSRCLLVSYLWKRKVQVLRHMVQDSPSAISLQLRFMKEKSTRVEAQGALFFNRKFSYYSIISHTVKRRRQEINVEIWICEIWMFMIIDKKALLVQFSSSEFRNLPKKVLLSPP